MKAVLQFMAAAIIIGVEELTDHITHNMEGTRVQILKWFFIMVLSNV